MLNDSIMHSWISAEHTDAFLYWTFFLEKLLLYSHITVERLWNKQQIMDKKGFPDTFIHAAAHIMTTISASVGQIPDESCITHTQHNTLMIVHVCWLSLPTVPVIPVCCMMKHRVLESSAHRVVTEIDSSGRETPSLGCCHCSCSTRGQEMKANNMRRRPVLLLINVHLHPPHWISQYSFTQGFSSHLHRVSLSAAACQYIDWWCESLVKMEWWQLKD